MLQFHCVAPSEQSSDSLMGRGERATVEHPVAADHLGDTVGLYSKKQRQQQTFHLVYFVKFMVESNYKLQSACLMTRVPHETHTQILSNTIR